MNSNDGLDYRVFRDQLQDVDGASQYLQEVFEMLRDTKPAVCALMRQYGYDKINGSTFASQRARLFAEHVLQFKPITIARNVTVQGDESLREEDLLTLAKAVNEDQKWANEIYLRVTFPRKFFSMFYDVELNPTDVLLKLAVRQQAMWDNEMRTREAVGKEGAYIVDPAAFDLLPNDYVLSEFFGFCQEPNSAEIEALAFITSNSERAVGDWFQRQRQKVSWAELLKEHAKDLVTNPAALAQLRDRVRVLLRTKGQDIETE